MDQQLCESKIYIDGGNDVAVCSKKAVHVGNHKCYGVPEWTDVDSERSMRDADDYFD